MKPILYNGSSGLYETMLHFGLQYYTRDQLRTLARLAGVKRGRNKEDTLKNLLKSGKIDISVKFVVSADGVASK